MKVINEPRSRFEQMNSKRSTKKYSYCFFDYLYYRLYVTYKKHNDPPRFSACIFTDFFFSRKNFTELQGGLIFISVAILFCIIPFYLRYTRKRTAAILLKYKDNKWNRIIPSWVIYTFPIWGFLTGIGICMLIFK